MITQIGLLNLQTANNKFIKNVSIVTEKMQTIL